MAHPRLRRPHQPWLVRFALGIFEFCASLKLAVLVILGSAVVLGVATFVEGRYGLQAAQFGVYGAWWFAALNGLLALNIFCAAAIRYPWKRHQTGFVITHIGLLTLLFGCLLTRRGGIDAQMPILEGDRGHIAYEGSESFELVELPPPGQSAAEPKVLGVVPFRGGPFSWADYAGFAWWNPLRYASRDSGVIFDRDGVRLEVLDYYSNAERVRAPRLELRMSAPRASRMNREGREELAAQSWMPITLNIAPGGPMRAQGIGAHQSMGGGGLTFSLALSPEETAAFLDSAPVEPIGSKGQLVLHAGGVKHTFNIEDLEGKGAVPLGDSGQTLELLRWEPSGERLLRSAEETKGLPDPARISPGVLLRLREGDRETSLRLFADAPELNEHDPTHSVYGVLWYDQGELTSQQLLQGAGNARIDILQSPDGKLYYRYWDRKKLRFAKELPADGTKVPAFEMPIGTLEMYVRRHDFAPKPETLTFPLPFDSKTTPAGALRAAKVRVTVDGQAKELFVHGFGPTYDDGRAAFDDRVIVEGKNRRVALRLPLDRVDTGFLVKLHEFEVTLDPGTSQPATFSSTVDILSPREPHEPLSENVVITMNAPVDVVDPVSGRSYRLFQESYFGPIPASDPLYRQRFPHGDGPDPWYSSTLTVNYDPGRGVKYLGCLLIVGGIATMFYMRAYFFKPQARAAGPEKPAAVPSQSNELAAAR